MKPDHLLRILIVDDDPEDAFLTTDLLNDVPSFGCETTHVTNGESAISALLGGAFDICLLDFRLGAMTGVEVLHAVQAQGCVTPCVLLTGQGDAETDRLALNAGAVDFLVKGRFDGDALVRTIRYAVRANLAVDTLRESEQRFRSVIEAATDAIVVVGDDGRIAMWNPKAVELFGAADQALDERSFFDWFQELHNARSIASAIGSLKQIAAVGDGDAIELSAVREDDTTFPAELTFSAWDADGETRWSVIVRNVSARKAMEQQLVQQAFHDPLTGLANRSLFRNRVEHAISRLPRYSGFVGVLFCDLDNFKRINDTLGHSAGDELLRAVGDRLSACIRPTDTAARLGGDEFAILIEDAVEQSIVLKVAQRILASLSKPIMVHGREVIVSASVGIDLTTSTEASADDLLRNADLAMYSAKSSGRARFAVFESSMHKALVRKLQIEEDLRIAIQRNEFQVVYQPILRLPDLTLRGFEALIRWTHPTRGPISPADFIPVAEELGLIVPIGRFVLGEACRALRSWHDEIGRSDFAVSVNLSPRQVERDGLEEVVRDVLFETRLSAHNLLLEITESAMVKDPKATAARLAKVADLGVRIAVDDFGTGYSSLSYLRDLPVHVLKVDRSFILGLAEGERGAALVRAIVAMAHSLGLETVAEGVEDAEQQQTLTDSGCDFAQGFLFARPLSADDTLTFLRQKFLAEPIPHAAPGRASGASLALQPEIAALIA